MSQQITPEMISAWIDGELSPAEAAQVEKAISTDDSLCAVYQGYMDAGSAVKDSAKWLDTEVSLPADFSSRVMAQVEALASSKTDHNEETSSAVPLVSKQQTQVWSVRTLIEIVAAVAAIVVITVVWQGSQQNGGTIDGGTARKAVDEDTQNQKPKNGVQALGSKNGEFKKGPIGNKGKTGEKNPASGNASSRKFSVFVSADSRPMVDRFWIMNNYEVKAPEGTEPETANNQVDVLLIDAKKQDAVKFFSQLKQWDPKYQVFQQAKSGSASWLAPFDVSCAEQSEGDFWTLQIVLINK